MAVTRITSRNIKDFTIEVGDLHDLGIYDGGGLNANYYSGTIRDDNSVISVVAGSVVLTDNTTNYVEVSAAGVVSTNTVGFTAGRIPLATVVTLSGIITTITEKRTWLTVDQSNATNFVDHEVPSGTINGVNAVFSLAFTPSPSSSLHISLNGLDLKSGSGNDYTLSGSTITFETFQIPQTGDNLLASYRY